MFEDFNSKLLLIPLISAFIGWLTNWVAVKMLFHPKEPVNLVVITLQGIFHKRQKEIATRLGETIEKKLFSHQDIHDKLTSPEFVKSIIPIIETKLDQVITEKLMTIHPMLALLPESMIQGFKEMLVGELEEFLPEMMEGASASLSQHIDIRKVIQEKIEAFEVEQLEEILFSLMKNEFKMIEYVGGVLGFFIGLSQVLLVEVL